MRACLRHLHCGWLWLMLDEASIRGDALHRGKRAAAAARGSRQAWLTTAARLPAAGVGVGQVGIVGANTSSMIKELMDNAVALQREAARKRVEAQARDKA